MGKMPELALMFKDVWKAILFIVIVLIAICVLNAIEHVYIAELEERLTKQEKYMHQVQADIDRKI